MIIQQISIIWNIRLSNADGLECTPDPTASCDGGIYAGVVGECVCHDGCSDCVDDLGNECTPPEGSVCVPELSGNGLSIGSDVYTHVAAECFCPESDCKLDPTNDGNIDCYTAEGDAICSVATSFLLEWLSILSISRTNSMEISPISLLMRLEIKIVQSIQWEIDNDGDGFVECSEFDLSAYRLGGEVVLSHW